jgi:hypothetical protein
VYLSFLLKKLAKKSLSLKTMQIDQREPNGTRHTVKIQGTATPMAEAVIIF